MERLGDRVLQGGTTTDPRPLRIILDTLSAAENISTACISLPEARALLAAYPELGAKALSLDEWSSAYHALPIQEQHAIVERCTTLVLVNTSFTSPFVHCLRDSDAWRAFEAFWFSKSALANDEPISLCSHSEPFGGSFGCAVIRLDEHEIALVMGPAWMSGSGWPNTELLAEKLASTLGGELSVTRLNRLMHHRGSVDGNDLLHRAQFFRTALELCLDTSVGGVPELRAEEIESLALLLLFCARNRLRLLRQPDGTVAPNGAVSFACREFAQRRYDGLPDDRQVFHFVQIIDEKLQSSCLSTERHPEALDVLSVQPPSGKPRLSARLSRFVDDYATNRNAYLLERILLLRLWLQAELSGDPEAQGSVRTLDSLARRLKHIFAADACNLYRYQSDDRSLLRIASYYDPSVSDGVASKSEELMRDAGKNDEQFKRSSCYRVATTLVGEFIRNAVDGQLLLTETEPPWKAVLAIPLLSNERIWGVLELKGLNPYQLLPSAKRWAEELARVVAPILAERWITKYIHEMGKVVLEAKTPDEKYFAIAECFARIFTASSATLYVQVPGRRTHLAHRAAIGRVLPLGAAIRLDEKDSVTSRAFEEGLIWSYCTIDDTELFSSRQQKENTRWLIENKHKHLAVAPLIGVDRMPLGSITLTATENSPFGPEQLPTIELIGRHVAALVETVAREERLVMTKRQEYAHTVKTRVPRTIEALDRVMTLLDPIARQQDLPDAVGAMRELIERYLATAGAARHDRLVARVEALSEKLIALAEEETNDITGQRGRRLTNAISVLRHNASELRLSAVHLAGGKDLDNPMNATATEWEGTWPRVRPVLDTVTRALHKRSDRNVFIPLPAEHHLPRDLRVRVPGQVLSEVLSNLIDNAIKYDATGLGAVAISATYRTGEPASRRLELEIINRAPPNSPEVKAKLGLPSFRSEFARRQDAFGSGLGLHYCIATGHAWGFDVEYTEDAATSDEAQTVVHRVKVTFKGENLHHGP